MQTELSHLVSKSFDHQYDIKKTWVIMNGFQDGYICFLKDHMNMLSFFFYILHWNSEIVRFASIGIQVVCLKMGRKRLHLIAYPISNSLHERIQEP
jgi:hypothetical protein